MSERLIRIDATRSHSAHHGMPHPGQAIDVWNFVIPGFLQSEGTDNGMVKIWRMMRARVASPWNAVELRSWCQRWSDLAELVWMTRPHSGLPVINVYAYSWGGWSARLFALELARRELRIRTMVLSDPVYRHSYILGQWRAFRPSSKIVIPPNVDEVFWYRQQNPRFQCGRSGGFAQPAGHDVVAAHPDTTVHEPVLLTCEHMYADDNPSFREKCLAVSWASRDPNPLPQRIST
ncbi:MAG: hypothetical protein AB7G12_12665 [Thermoanaerobaculia bacterium]